MIPPAANQGDEIDDDYILVDPYEVHAPSRRSDKELGRVLELLENLKTGKEITQ
jgi:hypothetical protein